MTDTIAAYDGVRFFDARAPQGENRRIVRLVRAIGRHAVIGVAAAISVGLLIVAVTLAAAWFAHASLSSNSQLQARAPSGPGTLALVPATAPQMTFEARWRRATGAVQIVAVPEQPIRHAAAMAPPPPEPPKVLAARATPLPKPRPLNGPQDQVQPEIARSPAIKDTARLATATLPPATPPRQRAATQEAHNKSMPPPDPEPRTAVYDIAAHTVYLPDGERLEAHSGLGDKLDDPRYVDVRMHGPTPPNIYDLSLRERLFHGVRAIRLNPVDDDKMFGRAGMLAHTYMLGPNGQSNGCVSFRDYSKFLQAFLTGKIDRLVVVSKLGKTSWRTAASRGYVPGGLSRHYAANSPLAGPGAVTR